MSISTETRFNLLTESLIRVCHRGTEKVMSLPQVLETLGKQGNIDFVALRPHQRHAWHAFLVQLAAMALYRADEKVPAQTAGRWTEVLRDMTDGRDDAWSLIVDDLSKPAFMQSPVPEGKIDHKRWKLIATPGVLDLLVTAKNHDIKSRAISAAKTEHWIFALISLQTMEGFLGAGNYGIARMNGGFASRPGVSLATDPSWNARFIRDVSILINRRNSLVTDPWPYPASGGHQLLWTLTWDGTEALNLSDCDPYFIENCRRIRVVIHNDNLVAFGLSTKTPRVNAKELRGVTGDPWVPITNDSKGPKALTISASGFDYRLVQQLLFSGDFQHGIAWRQQDERGDMFFLASGMTRGQGKTEGLHQRQLRIPAHASGLLINTKGRDRLAGLSKQRIEISDIVRRKVLHMALCQVTQAAPDGKLNFRDNKTELWLSNLDRTIDTIFFERLFSQLELDDDKAVDDWTRELISLALEQLENALQSTPQPSIRHYRIESAARGMFHGLARKHFPDLYEDTKQGEAHV